MLIVIISIALGIVLFLCLYLGFRTGLRLGMNSARGITPPPIKSPVKAVQDIKSNIEQAKADDAFNKGFAALMGYDGDMPKEE